MFIRSGYSAHTRSAAPLATEDHYLRADVLGRLGDLAHVFGLEPVRGALRGQPRRRDGREVDGVVGRLALAGGRDQLAHALDPYAVVLEPHRHRLGDEAPAVGL